MTDKSYNNWQLSSDSFVEEAVGNYIKTERKRQNKTQAMVAEAADISRSTLSLLERGETVTLATLIRVLRVLNQMHVFQAFEVREQESPIALAKRDKAKRQRVRPKKSPKKSSKKTEKKSDW